MQQPPAAAWAVGMEPAPDDARLLEAVAGPLAAIAGDSSVTTFFHQLAARDPPITTVSEIKTKLTNSELQSAARGTVKPATLRTLGNLLVPGGFSWAAKLEADAAQPAKRKRGGGSRNNKPTVDWKEQLELEGVEALSPATFKFAPGVFDGVPKKGEAARLNGYEQVLFDNTWLEMSQVGAAHARATLPRACAPAARACSCRARAPAARAWRARAPAARATTAGG